MRRRMRVIIVQRSIDSMGVSSAIGSGVERVNAGVKMKMLREDKNRLDALLVPARGNGLMGGQGDSVLIRVPAMTGDVRTTGDTQPGAPRI